MSGISIDENWHWHLLALASRVYPCIKMYVVVEKMAEYLIRTWFGRQPGAQNLSIFCPSVEILWSASGWILAEPSLFTDGSAYEYIRHVSQIPPLNTTVTTMTACSMIWVWFSHWPTISEKWWPLIASNYCLPSRPWLQAHKLTSCYRNMARSIKDKNSVPGIMRTIQEK